MRKIVPLLICNLLFINLIIATAHSSTSENNQVVTITSNSANIRTGPTTDAQIIKTAQFGDSFPLISSTGEWYNIMLADGSTGYVANWLATISAGTEDKVNPSENNKQIGIVASTDLRLREEPNESAPIINHLNKGTVVTIEEVHSDWVNVTYNTQSGWVAKQYITIKQLPEGNEATSSGVITASILNVRETPSEQSKIVGKLTENTEVTIINEQTNWLEIVYELGTGWVNSAFVEKITTTSSQQQKNQIEIPDHLSGIVGTITASTLNVRKKPTYRAKIVSSVSYGEHFEILEEKSNWSKIKFNSDQTGWVANWFLQKHYLTTDTNLDGEKASRSSAKIIYDQTNLREQPNEFSPIVKQANIGEEFEITRKYNDWFEVKINRKESAFVAGWLVETTGSVTEVTKPGPEQYLINKTIVIDPGHGGYDRGTTGAHGTIEKQLTLKTAQLTANKLREAGANVILTRTNDSYVSLPARVQKSNYTTNVDAFISIHFDSIENDTSINGMTTYYYYNFQQSLANNIHDSVIRTTKLKNRGTKEGDYFVLRENHHNGVLLELGYLSNPTEESYLTTTHFQEAVATGIYLGLANYFK